MGIYKYSPKELFEEPFLFQYEKAINILWWEIVRLNSTIFVLKRITAFDFRLFRSDINKDHFWQMVKQSFYEVCLLCLWKIEVDNDYDKGTTLSHLKNEVIRNIIKSDIKECLIAEIKKTNYKKNVENVSNKVRLIRHNVVGHLNFDGIPFPEPPQEVKISLREIKYFTFQINSLFKLLCFKEQKFVAPLEYYDGPELHKHPMDRADIDHLLDFIVKESDFFKMPNEIPEIWERIKGNRTEEEIIKLNYYRNKFGLDKIL